MRPIAKKYKDLGLGDIQKLLKSKIHEERQTALLILVDKFQRVSKVPSDNSIELSYKRKLFDFYLKNTKYINNWDLVDLSAPKIVGEYLIKQSEKTHPNLRTNSNILYKLVKSKNLWQRRIAILATFTFIKNNQFAESLKIAEMLLNDKQDLIHKANGWMLREVGKRSQKTLEKFLKKNVSKMPRTMLRYSIERFSKSRRRHFLLV